MERSDLERLKKVEDLERRGTYAIFLLVGVTDGRRDRGFRNPKFISFAPDIQIPHMEI